MKPSWIAGRKEERKDRIKSVAFRHPTKPIHLTPNPVQPSPKGEAEWKGRGRFCSRTKIWQICRDLPKNGGEVHSATPLPRVPRILPTLPPLPQRGWRAKGWLLNYLDRTKRNKWRWIGPLMRYWPITATHVYWYRRIRAARLPPLPSLCLSFLSKNSPLRRRTVSAILMERCLILSSSPPRIFAIGGGSRSCISFL